MMKVMRLTILAVGSGNTSLILKTFVSEATLKNQEQVTALDRNMNMVMYLYVFLLETTRCHGVWR